MPRNVQMTFRKPAGSPLGLARLGLVALLLACALALVSGARALDNPSAAITLDPVSVNDGAAVVSGSVGRDSAATVQLEINGQPVGVDSSGDFSAVVDLEHEAALVLSTTGTENEKVTIRIPLTALPQSGSVDVLDALNDAGISIDVPPDGFQVVDGQLPVVSGRVLNSDTLSSFTVNGQDVLTLLGPGGSFSIPLTGSDTKQVTFVATDRQGASQTSAFRTTQVTSAIKTKAGMTVSAAGAQGVVVAKIRFDKTKLLTKRRLGVVVTIKDRRGYLIRGAALHLKGMPLRYFATGAGRASFTNRVGQKRFSYLLKKSAFTTSARRLTLVVRADTPRASAKKTARLRLPAVLPT